MFRDRNSLQCGLLTNSENNTADKLYLQFYPLTNENAHYHAYGYDHVISGYLKKCLAILLMP